MSSKSKQLSVLIAGGTGQVGQELVTRLVSHPDVSRVVVLSRHPIPVSRWRTFFPKMHTGDALRYLSVVTVDWDRISCDAARVPIAYVTRGEWIETDADHEGPSAFTPGTFDGNDIFEDFWSDRTADRSSGHRTGKGRNWGTGVAGSRMEHSMCNVYADDEARAGGVARFRDSDFRGRSGYGNVDYGVDVGSSDTARDALDSHGAGERPLIGYVEEYSRGAAGGKSAHFLDKLLRNTFYGTVFRGHHVVINALDTYHPLSSTSTTLVGYRYSIAFAKIVRIFNSMIHAEPTEEEEEQLVKRTSKELDSALWGEIYTACYGKTDKGGSVDREIQRKRLTNTLSGCHSQTGVTPEGKGGWTPGQAVSAAATLKQFTQISVMGASEFSPIPYLRIHGQRDSDVMRLFNRDHDSLMRNLARLNDEVTDAEEDRERVARKRAEMLLRRDIVKTCNSNHLTIWRPGLFEGGRQWWLKHLLGLFSHPVRTDYLAELVVQDIMESIEDERSFDEMGTVKVVSGKSVALRAKLKAVEDQLNRRDTRKE